jgi:ribosomal protein S11
MSTIDPTKPMDRYECEEVLGGEFKTTWIDCRQPRDPTITTQFACEDCNARFDCDCPVADHCVNRQCVPCLDSVVEVPLVAGPAWHDTGIPVGAGDTVTLIAKRCDELEWGTTIRSQVGDGFLQTGGPTDEYIANDSGTLLVRLERQGAPAAGQLCVRVTSNTCSVCLLVRIRYTVDGEPQPNYPALVEVIDQNGVVVFAQIVQSTVTGEYTDLGCIALPGPEYSMKYTQQNLNMCAGALAGNPLYGDFRVIAACGETQQRGALWFC